MMEVPIIYKPVLLKWKNSRKTEMWGKTQPLFRSSDDFTNYRSSHLHVIALYHGWFPWSFFKSKSEASLTLIQIHQFPTGVIK